MYIFVCARAQFYRARVCVCVCVKVSRCKKNCVETFVCRNILCVKISGWNTMFDTARLV